MRTLLLISVVATSLIALAACDDTQSTTAPTSARVVTAPAGQASIDVPTNQAKPGQGPAAFTTVTVAMGNEVPVNGISTNAAIICPLGTTRTGGGYTFTVEGSSSAPPVVIQNMPIANGWWVRVANNIVGHQYAVFRAYALCAS
jgi:hypothetical protein